MNREVGVARQYRVWDRTTRIFHWLNFLCVLALSVLGTIMLNGKLLGLAPAGSLLVKTLHAYVGYVFVLNLAWRLVWAFVGNRYARWSALLPFGKRYLRTVREQLRALRIGQDLAYVGHSPLARLMIGALLLLLVIQAITGLVIAGTDLYLPPFGSYFAEWVTNGDPARLALLQPGSTEHVVGESLEAMKVFRRPFKEVHEYSFYLLLVAVALHILANVLEEARHATGQISSMFSGVKTLTGRPADGTGD
jgi:cytochrome b